MGSVSMHNKKQQRQQYAEHITRLALNLDPGLVPPYLKLVCGRDSRLEQDVLAGLGIRGKDPTRPLESKGADVQATKVATAESVSVRRAPPSQPPFQLLRFTRLTATVILIATVTLSIWLWSDHPGQKHLTDPFELDSNQSRQVALFLERLLLSRDDSRGADIPLSTVVADASSRLDENPPQDKRVAAHLHSLLGRAAARADQDQSARQNLSRALALRHQAELANSPQQAADYSELASLLQAQGNLAHASYYYGQSLDTFRTLQMADTLEYAQSLASSATLFQAQRLYGEAETHLVQALDIYEALLPALHPAKASALYSLAQILEAGNRLEEAVDYYRSALDMNQALHGKNHLDGALILNNLGSILDRLGKFDNALLYYRRALQIRQELLAPDDPEIGITLHNIATNAFRRGKLSEAESQLRRALAQWATSVDDKHPYLASTLLWMGRTLYRLDRLDEARIHLRQALSIRQEHYPDDHFLVANARVELARTLTTDPVRAEAESLFLEAIGSLKSSLGQGHPHTRAALLALIEFYRAGGRIEDARFYRAALDAPGN